MSNAVLDNLKVKIFADGADINGMLEMKKNPLIKGFTTNPTLMCKAGISDYEAFARDVLDQITEEPVSFEVFADEFDEMGAQALKIASWGKNVNVKIPVMNTKREFAGPLLERLSAEGVVLNVTAIMTNEQVKAIAEAIDPNTASIISVFAGRIADTGRDPVPLMNEANEILKDLQPKADLLWASPRELLNIFQADETGCGIITVTNDVLKKLGTVGKDLDDFSAETVQMFYDDACAAGFKIDC
ncbi:transaldolase [Thalassospira lucentensis]|uniref:transaldolase n=1 Tax=Thalassospira lucentensis TaxID=168935 RepID=UPI0029425283|nr:transaldolase [Thalassospira lucentensis]WOI11829.1 transaldolase [Thalassospira lucentensis]